METGNQFRGRPPRVSHRVNVSKLKSDTKSFFLAGDPPVSRPSDYSTDIAQPAGSPHTIPAFNVAHGPVIVNMLTHRCRLGEFQLYSKKRVPTFLPTERILLMFRLPAAAGLVSLSAWLFSPGISFCQKVHEGLPYLNPRLPVEQRVDDLLRRMTIEEKVAQLQSTLSMPKGRALIPFEGLGGVGPLLRPLAAERAAMRADTIQQDELTNTRLAIPVMIHDEALHGLVGNGATSFPQAIALASTWDPELMGRVAAVIGREARTRGIRQVLSPVVNIARDVRWGRVEETYGEDPYLSSTMGAAFCTAIERQGVATTPKHFVANVGDGGRDSYPINLSERLLREIFFPPFEACIKEGRASSIMAAYNSLNGLPCSADPWLLSDVLRKEWGFSGFVVSDYGSAAGIMNMHHVAANELEAASLGLAAGLDVELPDIYVFGRPLLDAVRIHRVPMQLLDDAVRRVLRVKFRLGMFEDRMVSPDTARAVNNAPTHRALAREAARKAVVLLKNDGNILPLRRDLTSIAVIGPAANDVNLGGYSGFGMRKVSILEGIRNTLSGSSKVTGAQGCAIGFAALPPIPAMCLVPSGDTRGLHGLRGEYFNNISMSGRPALVRTDSVINFDWAMGSPDPEIPVDSFSVRWTGYIVPRTTGVYKLGASTDDGLRLYIDGKLLIDSWFDRGRTLDFVEVKLEAGKRYTLQMEYYEKSGYAYAGLVWDLKDRPNPLLTSAVETARNADVALVAVQIQEGEGYDRADLDLPAPEEELISAVAATGTPTVVVLVDGSAVTMDRWASSVAGIVQAWYGGEEAGNGLADILFGYESPGGRLPITFPRFVGQVPLFYNHEPTGRGDNYADMSGKPLFPFGYGLSYTSFSYSGLTINPDTLHRGGVSTVSVNVTNTGKVKGDEVVQLYLHRRVASVTQPVETLKGYSRVTLAPGESRTVVFSIGPDKLSFLDRNLNPVVEPGDVDILIGSSSSDIRATGIIHCLGR